MNIRENRQAIKNGQSRETGNIWYTKHKTQTNKTKHTTQYVFDTTMSKQTKITAHRLYADIVTVITSWNQECNDTQ